MSEAMAIVMPYSRVRKPEAAALVPLTAWK